MQGYRALILGKTVFSEKKIEQYKISTKPNKKVKSVNFFLISNLNKYTNAPIRNSYTLKPVK